MGGQVSFYFADEVDTKVAYCQDCDDSQETPEEGNLEISEKEFINNDLLNHFLPAAQARGTLYPDNAANHIAPYFTISTPPPETLI